MMFRKDPAPRRAGARGVLPACRDALLEYRDRRADIPRRRAESLQE
jgi:hypothetical protein